MLTLQIKAPIWHKRAVGIAEHRLSAGETVLEIAFTDKKGNKVYPHIFSITREKILKYPLEIRYGVRLRIVPIQDLTIHTFREADGTEKPNPYR